MKDPTHVLHLRRQGSLSDRLSCLSPSHSLSPGRVYCTIMPGIPPPTRTTKARRTRSQPGVTVRPSTRGRHGSLAPRAFRSWHEPSEGPTYEEERIEDAGTSSCAVSRHTTHRTPHIAHCTPHTALPTATVTVTATPRPPTAGADDPSGTARRPPMEVSTTNVGGAYCARS